MSILCLPLAHVSICVFLYRKGVVCVFLRYRMTVARAEREGQCTCRPCRGRSRAAGRGEVAVVPHSSVLLSRCMGSQAAPRLVLYLLFSCLALQRGGPCWPGLGGFAGSGVGLISSGGPSKAWSPPPGVLWAAAHSPHWSGSLPSPLSTACISVAWFYLRELFESIKGNSPQPP